MKRRGQASMEFLMVYGWAILAAVLAIGALAYFGAFSPGRSTSGLCYINAPFGCQEYVVANDGVRVVMINGAGHPVAISNFSVVGCGSNDSGGAGFTVKDGGLLDIFVPCSPRDSGDKFTGEIIVAYKKVGKQIDNTVGGTVTSEVRDTTMKNPSGSSVCGNNVIEGGETCDDGNLIDGDWCSSTCQLEPCVDGVDTKPCSNQQGVCEDSYETCNVGVWDGCDGSNYGGNYQETESTCDDGLDNDCNSFPDGVDSNCGTPGLVARFLHTTDTHIHTGGLPTPSATDGRTDNCNSSYFLPNFQYFNDKYCEDDNGSKAPTIAFEDMVDVMNLYPDVDFMVVTGDLIAQGKLVDANTTDSIDKFTEIIGGLTSSPYYVTVDYKFHDNLAANRDYFTNKLGELNWNFTIGTNLFIGLSEVNMQLFNETLDYYSNQGFALFAFNHYDHLSDDIADFLNTYSDNFTEIIFVQGHWHINNYTIEGDVHRVVTTSSMNYPTEFRVFDVYNDRVEIYMSGITSPEINNVSETLVDWYLEPSPLPSLSRADPTGTKEGLTGDPSERTITINF